MLDAGSHRREWVAHKGTHYFAEAASEEGFLEVLAFGQVVDFVGLQDTLVGLHLDNTIHAEDNVDAQPSEEAPGSVLPEYLPGGVEQIPKPLDLGIHIQQHPGFNHPHRLGQNRAQYSSLHRSQRHSFEVSLYGLVVLVRELPSLISGITPLGYIEKNRALASELLINENRNPLYRPCTPSAARISRKAENIPLYLGTRFIMGLPSWPEVNPTRTLQAGLQHFERVEQISDEAGPE